VLKAWEFPSKALQPFEIDGRHGNPLAVWYARDDRTPGVDDHRVAVGGSAMPVVANLSRRKHI
jgi:hypothetical protein